MQRLFHSWMARRYLSTLPDASETVWFFKSHLNPMYTVEVSKGWSLLRSQGIPSVSDTSSMSCRLYVKRRSCGERGELFDRSLMGLEQSSLNSS